MEFFRNTYYLLWAAAAAAMIVNTHNPHRSSFIVPPVAGR